MVIDSWEMAPGHYDEKARRIINTIFKSVKVSGVHNLLVDYKHILKRLEQEIPFTALLEVAENSDYTNLYWEEIPDDYIANSNRVWFEIEVNPVNHVLNITISKIHQPSS